VRVGDLSYSWYLWHWPFIVFAAVLWPTIEWAPAVAALVSLLPSAAAFSWFEQPIRRNRFRWSSSLLRLAGVVILVPIAAATLLAIGARASWWLAWPTSAAASQFDHVAFQNCTDVDFDPTNCTWGPDSDETLFLVGDSQAYAVADGVIAAAATRGMRVTVSSQSGCPLVSAGVAERGPGEPGCQDWRREVSEYIRSEQPSAVIIANLSYAYSNPGWERTPPPLVEQSIYASQTYLTNLKILLDEISPSDSRVIIFQVVPSPSRADLSTSPSIIRRLFPTKPPTSFSSQWTDIRAAHFASVEEILAEDYPQVSLFDPTPYLCPMGVCLLSIEGKAVYLDPLHLSRDGALHLTTPLSLAIHEATIAPTSQ